MWISARKCSKSAVKRPVFAFRELEGVPNRKKVAKKSDFLFLQGADQPSGADPAKDAWRHGFLLLGERCVFVGQPVKNKASRCCEALLC